MLASLTSTAVTRGWHPSVYARLVSQLQDSSDAEGGSTTLEAFKTLIQDGPPNPLLCEYVCTLSKDPHSPLFFPHLLNWLASTEIPRPQRIKELVCYVGRFANEEWKLPEDYSQLDHVASACAKIIEQALAGAQESKLLLTGLAVSVIPRLMTDLPEWKAKIEPLWKQLGLAPHLVAEDSSELIPKDRRASTVPDTVRDSRDSLEDNSSNRGHSSRALRLLWLDWFIRTAQPLNYGNVRRQLDLTWPGDRDNVISYELCVTAFDVLASPGPDSPPVLAEAFITKALPLLLHEMGFEKSIDGVLARVFTTLDKAVVESVEQRRPGIRAEFGAACIDIGLCDPTVLHALHRSHKPQPPLPSAELPSVDQIISKPTDFLQLNPVNQRELASTVAQCARGTISPLGRHKLALLCSQLLRFPEFADTLFVFVSVRDFLDVICTYADTASALPDEDGGAGLVYSDLGALLVAAKWLSTRYQNVELPSGSTANYLQRREFATLTQLTAEQTALMGNWIIGLFSGSGSGIADELLRPFNELGEILPVLLRQAILAYRSAVIDRETLKSGLDYFAHSFSVTLLAPIVVLILKADLFECTHQSTSLECLIFFLTIMIQKKDPEFDIAKAVILGTARQISADLAADDASFLGGPAEYSSRNANLKKLKDAFNSLVNELATQVPQTFAMPPPTLYGLGETMSLSETVKASSTALMNWQLRPQGVPVIPAVYKRAKSALGPQVTRELIDKATSTQSPDTTIAILVCDGLWSKRDLLIDTDDSSVSQIAGDVVKQFHAILEDQPKAPEIIIGDVKLAQSERVSATQDIGLPPSASQNNNNHDFGAPEGANEDIDRLGGEGDNNNSMNVDNRNLGGGLDAFDGSIDPLSQPLTNEFDNDFASQPMMNLADLDSAMDFAWD